MKKNWVRGVLSVVMVLHGVGASVAAESMEGAVETSAAAPASLDAEAWKDRLKEVRVQRNVFLGGSVLAVVAGGAMYFSGAGDFNDAKNTPGCTYDGGSTIFCQDEPSRAAAQDQLDSGQQKMIIGGVVTLGGLGLALIGAIKSGELGRLQKEGKQKGYSVTLEPRGLDGAQLLCRRSF